MYEWRTIINGPDDTLGMSRMIWICAYCTCSKALFFAWCSLYMNTLYWLAPHTIHVFIEYIFPGAGEPYLEELTFSILWANSAIAPYKMGYPQYISLCSPQKHLLWVLIRSTSEVLLMSTHNICFCGETRKITILFSWKNAFYLKLCSAMTFSNIILIFPRKKGMTFHTNCPRI